MMTDGVLEDFFADVLEAWVQEDEANEFEFWTEFLPALLQDDEIPSYQALPGDRGHWAGAAGNNSPELARHFDLLLSVACTQRLREFHGGSPWALAPFKEGLNNNDFPK